MKTFVINLKRETNKKNYMQTHLDLLGLNYEFIDAVDGNQLDDKLLKQTELKALENIQRFLTKSELGCLLSHRSVYKKIIDDTNNYYLILEDDVVVSPKVKEVLNYITTEKPKFDVFLLGFNNGKSESFDIKIELFFHFSEKLKIGWLKDIAYGTYGYIISKSGAERLLLQSNELFMPIDHFTNNYKDLRVLCLSKPLIKIHKELDQLSNLNFERQVARAYAKYPKLLQCLINNLMKSSDKLVIYGLNQIGYFLVSEFKDRVLAVVDKTHQVHFKDIKTLSIYELAEMYNQIEYKIIVCALNIQAVSEIKKSIHQAIKKPNIVFASDYLQ